jgi:hypothetical protein
VGWGLRIWIGKITEGPEKEVILPTDVVYDPWLLSTVEAWM